MANEPIDERRRAGESGSRRESDVPENRPENKEPAEGSRENAGAGADNPRRDDVDDAPGHARG
jgi:hypothetical protein